jgi:hypothetical protein
MSAIFSLDTLGLLLLTVFPGAVSLTVYRLFMPARPLEWKDITVQGLFYSVINYALLLPLLPFVLNAGNQDTHPRLYEVTGKVRWESRPRLGWRGPTRRALLWD